MIDLNNPPERLMTSDGRVARVIGKRKTNDDKQFVLLIENKQGTSEWCYYANQTGQQVWFDTGALSTLTLIAGPVKKEGWINIYRDGPAAVMHLTKRAADSANSSNHGARVHCAYVTWEE